MLADILSTLGEYLYTAYALLLVLFGFSLVVFVHELGHFLAAKWAKVRVEKFCIGFGKELFGFTWGETRYGFNMLPLGGYVKMLGQEDFAVDKTGELMVKDEQGSFTSKTIGQRMVIVSAGVVMNLIFAAIGMTLYMMMGYHAAPAEVGSVVPGTAAARAGLQTGDVITDINGDAVREYNDLQQFIALSNPGERLNFGILRDGRAMTIPILPEFNDDAQLRQVGITNPWTTRVHGFVDSAGLKDPPENLLRTDDQLVAAIRDGQEVPMDGMAQVQRLLSEARGQPIELVVNRPKGELTPAQRLGEEKYDGPQERVRVQARASWFAEPEVKSDLSTASLLGLVPRILTGDAEDNSPADQAGVKPLDAIARFGSAGNPTASEIASQTLENPGKELPLVVERQRTANGELSADAVWFVARHREEWLAQAVKDGAAARTAIQAALDSSALAENDRMAIAKQSAEPESPEQWLAWLEGVDRHETTITPHKPFKLFGGAVPTNGLRQLRLEEDRLIVAFVMSDLNGRPSPAAAAGIPAGAVIVAADGQPLRTWADLSEAFRTHAGQSVTVRYREGIEYREASIAVPESIMCALGVPPGARISEINKQSRVEFTNENDTKTTLLLPDWRAARRILNDNVGNTVSVKWTDNDGVEHDGRFAVTAENADPWAMRLMYVPGFTCFPKAIKIRETNPLLAAKAGIAKTYWWTWNTIQSIRHIAFTRQVGVDKLSGPLGIAKTGVSIAQADWTGLLFFMCVISANLAVINFLPLPIVDGGLFLFLVLEKIRGEPLSIKTQVFTQMIGIALIAFLFVFVTFQDIMNWSKL